MMDEQAELKTNDRSGDESGQALADYALILTFIFAVCVIAAGLLGVAVRDAFNSILPGF